MFRLEWTTHERKPQVAIEHDPRLAAHEPLRR